MEYIVMGIVTAFNLLIIKWKLEKARYADGGLDLLLMFCIVSFFSGSFGGMLVGMVASFVISIYLMIFPPKLPEQFKADLTEIFKDLKQ